MTKLFPCSAFRRISMAVIGLCFPLSDVLTMIFVVRFLIGVSSLTILVRSRTVLSSVLMFRLAPVDIGVTTVLLLNLLVMILRRTSLRPICLGPVLGPLIPPIVTTSGIPVVPVRRTVLTARGTMLLLVVIIRTMTLAIPVLCVCTVANVVRFGALRKSTMFPGALMRHVLTRRATLLVLLVVIPAWWTQLSSEAPLRLMRFTTAIIGGCVMVLVSELISPVASMSLVLVLAVCIV